MVGLGGSLIGIGVVGLGGSLIGIGLGGRVGW